MRRTPRLHANHIGGNGPQVHVRLEAPAVALRRDVEVSEAHLAPVTFEGLGPGPELAREPGAIGAPSPERRRGGQESLLSSRYSATRPT